MRHLGEAKAAIGCLIYVSISSIIGLFWYEIESPTEAIVLICLVQVICAAYVWRNLSEFEKYINEQTEIK